MASLSACCLYAAILLGLCSATTSRDSCPSPCDCQNATIACTGCPNNYITLSTNMDRMFIKGCKDIQYLLRLHQRPEGATNATKYTLSKLEIRDSFVRQPESFIYNDYNTESLILTNNSITKVSADGKRTNLTFLDLSHNKIDYVENRTFVNMNKLLYLNLSDNRIINMDSQCFDGLENLLHLDLSSNNLTYLSDVVFLPLMSLQQLNLSANNLEVLSERSFSSLLLLQQLDISYNKLTSVAPGTLQFLPNLAKLLMADNPHLRPNAQIFVGTGRRLQQVDASRTGLSQVPEALTHSVRYLTLAGNRIAVVSCGDLDSYPLLHMLDFSDNIIVEIEDDALGRLEMLSQLYLNKNRLQTVPKMLPDKLSYLSLDNNFIQNLTILDFITLTGLKMLIISNNNISDIQENAFIQLVSLEVLDLSNNPLKTLTPNTFSGPTSLKDLRIAFVNISPPAKDISFPVPSPEGIENLHLEFSPGLTRQLMADTAALAAMTRLQHLDVRYSNITTLRSDLLHFLPELKVLRLEGNKLVCTDLEWLTAWMRENVDNNYDQVKCFSPPALRGKMVKDLQITSNAITVPDEKTLKNEKLQKKQKTSSNNDIAKLVTNTNGDNVSNRVKNSIRPAFDKLSANDTKTESHQNGTVQVSRDNIPPVEKIEDGSTTKPSLIDYSAGKSDARMKLLQIFSEWSQEVYNNNKHNLSNAETIQKTVSCNGTENDTKCSQNPRTGDAVVENDKPTLRKNESESSANTTEKSVKRIIDEQSSSPMYEVAPRTEMANVSLQSSRLYAEEENLVVHDEVSEYRTSRFSAEASGGVGMLAAAGALAAVGAALTAAWVARRRPRPRPQDLMEVPTIAAVGELW